MSRQLSHSQINTYATCPKKFELHYISRLREQVTSAALLFGTALDHTLNPMLLDLKAGQLKKLEHYQDLLLKNWLNGKINDTYHYLPECTLIAYAESDYDEELLTDNDILSLKESYPNYVYEQLAEQKRIVGIENIPVDHAKFINNTNWLSMLRKGELMVKTYYEQVLPKIKEVVDVQVKIELKNDSGDSVVGYIDAILDFGDGPRIVDNKTAARAYENDAANISPQLAVYAYSKNITKTAFIVLSKQVKKNRTKICSKCGNDGSGGRAQTCDKEKKGVRCRGEWTETVNPEATVEIILGDVNPVFSEHVIENYEHTLTGINAGVFPRNFNSCNSYGRKCAFFDLCHTGTGEDKLVKV